VKSHEGELSYDPPLEGGAEFRVVLPLHDAPAETAELERGPARPPESRRVLVVDADPGVHRLVHALLSPEGMTVESVRTGEQGLLLAADHAYDLIIADARMTAGASELFVHALVAAYPEAVDRLVLTYSDQMEPPNPLPDHPVPRARKPFNLRDLRALASQVLASTPPRSPASRAAR
jgi:CheY-like chemotaxis protein